MLTPGYTNRFGKDLTLVKKRGKDTEKLKKVIELIVAEQPLPPRLRDHLPGRPVQRSPGMPPRAGLVVGLQAGT
ncbi:MAG TPA: type II toxin-antitoxin system mRNA interferase toxin, RelE/StbE family [Lamprocystis sp. (in: g-proteobacteria)]|nr:type II toxin-antitoxin system mRNA interferase toxin, RelE/StbE family [Lamprocystis sp. (in: g-proteobacteria)]